MDGALLRQPGQHQPSGVCTRKIGCLNWGLVAGKTNTIYPWQDLPGISTSVTRFTEAEPELWFHDLFRADGTPYDRDEVELFRRYTRAVPVHGS